MWQVAVVGDVLGRGTKRIRDEQQQPLQGCERKHTLGTHNSTHAAHEDKPKVHIDWSCLEVKCFCYGMVA